MLAAIPDSIITAGLVGCGLALVVATAQQKWQLKAFFLLALRLAIGWQFLFEGLYKINTELVGPSETNRVFSSEPYFKVSPTLVGAMMRKNFEDPSAVLETLNPRDFPADRRGMFLGLDADGQTALCPDSVAREFDTLLGAADEAVQAEAASETRLAIKQRDRDIWKVRSTEAAAKVLAAFAKASQDAQTKAGKTEKLAAERVKAAKTAYARWIFGIDGRDAKVKFVNGDVALSVPERLRLIAEQKQRLKYAEAYLENGVGIGNGAELKRASEQRIELNVMESDLAKDAKAFVAELKKDLSGKAVQEPVVESRGRQLDRVTMWFIAIVGGCILFGFLTRLSCILAAGFLLVTYLAHPPFPWYTLPPMTEGNPLFVNKNFIEMLALVVLACYPTGRWLGLDAILALAIPYCRKRNADLIPGG